MVANVIKSMNRFNPKKLLYTRWTKRYPVNNEKHYIVNKLELDHDNHITLCVIEAIINNKEYEIDWHMLQNEDIWIQGWQ